MRYVFLVSLLIETIYLHASEPEHALMDHRYWACEQSKSLEGGIYGKGPFKKFGPTGVCSQEEWRAVSQEEFRRLASEWYRFDWSEEIPFWQPPEVRE